MLLSLALATALAEPTFYAALSLPAGKLPAGFETTIGTVEKRASPVFVQDQPWEPRLDNGYPNIVYDPANTDGKGVFRCWYGDCIANGCNTQVLLYANSSDGLTWTKPELGLFDVGSVRKDLAHIGKANNIIMKGGGIGIYNDPHESDPTKKFKAFGSGCFSPVGSNCRNPTGGVASSPDGMVWGDSQALRWPQPQRYDCHSNLFWDPSRNDYVATTRDGFSHGSGRDIGIQRSLPGKFAWNTTTAPALVEVGTPAAQLYSQITFPFHDVYLGIVMVFDAQAKEGHVHCRLAWSTDASTWAWVDAGGLTGKEFIPHGTQSSSQNAFDSHVCFAAASPVEMADEVRVYYMGGNGPHSGARNSSLGLATLGLDRYAGVSNTGTATSTFTTKSIKCTGAKLLLSADVGVGSNSKGQIKVGAVGVEGLGLDDAVAVTSNVTRSAVGFSGGKDFTSLIGKTVTLQIEVSVGASVYAVGFV